MGNHLVEVANPEKAARVSSKDVEDLLVTTLNECMDGEYLFTVHMVQPAKLNGKGPGVMPLRVESHSVYFKIKTKNDNGTCYEARIICPDGVDANDLLAAMKQPPAPTPSPTKKVLQSKKQAFEQRISANASKAEVASQEIEAAQARVKPITCQINELRSRLEAAMKQHEGLEGEVKAKVAAYHRLLSEGEELKSGLKEIDAQLARIEDEERMAEMARQKAEEVRATLAQLSPDVLAILRQQNILR